MLQTFLRTTKPRLVIIFFLFYVCFHLDLCEDGSTNPPGGGLRFICFSTSFCSSFSFSASSSISRTRALIASSSWDTKKNNNESQLPIMKCHWHRLYRPFTTKRCCPTCQYHYQIFSLKRRKGFSFSSTLSDNVLCEGFIWICIQNYFWFYFSGSFNATVHNDVDPICGSVPNMLQHDARENPEWWSPATDIYIQFKLACIDIFITSLITRAQFTSHLRF